MVTVPAEATVAIRVHYPKGALNQEVHMQVEDGGQILETKSIAHKGKLDKGNELTFNFQVTSQLGIYRISLRQGDDVKVLQFWVGSLPPTPVPVTKIPKF